MQPPRDVLVLAVTAIACVASIASDSEVSDQARLEGVDLEERNVFSFDVTIGPQQGVFFYSSLNTSFDAFASVATDAEGAAALEDISAILFAIDDDGERGDALDTGTGRAGFTDDDVIFSSSVNTNTKIDDCTSAPCVRRFELELTTPLDFVGIADVGGGAFNNVSGDITVEIQQLE